MIDNDCECLFENDFMNDLHDNISKCMIDVLINDDEININKIAILNNDNMNNNLIEYDIMGGRPSVNLKINGIKIGCLLDTGAKISVIELKLLNRIGIYKIKESDISIKCANESQLQIVGKVNIKVELNNLYKKIDFYVAKKISPAVIGGINLLDLFNIRLKFNPVNEIKESLNSIEPNNNSYKIEIQNDVNIQNILKEYDDIFMKHKWDVGKTELIKHEILTNSKPIVMNPRRQPYHLIEKINKNVQEMEDNGIISKCESPWNSPLVCVKKRDKDDIRICLDYRALNDVTERPIFPIPNTQEMLDTLQGARFFTSLDLGNAYYQVELDENSKLKTAFSTQNAQYCFNRMPFGIAAAPATFQKLMNSVLGSLNWKEAVVYLDDILIFSSSLNEHYKRIRNVLDRIRKANLKISPTKCHFLKEEIKFLGHVINKSGIRTDENKIDSIKHFERPKCIKKLRSFLGLTNYYRKFIKDYSKYSKILESLIGSNQKKLLWTNECENAFNNLKEQLTKAPVLMFPNFSKEFILDTDASFDRIGAVLAQIDENGKERVIAYGSKAMSKHELGYCITRKELLAIFYFTQHFKHYLYGKRFNLRTDHKAIVFMLKTKKLITPQFQTWINHLSSLDMKIEYRKGSDHSNADALSRTNCETCIQCQTIHEDPKSGKLKTKILSLMLENYGTKWQENSQEIQEIKMNIENGISKNFKFIDNIIYTVDNKIWIPEERKIEFITYTHSILCHAGFRKVLEYIN